MFSEAEAYERFMGRWSRQLGPVFARFARITGGHDVLDVGCGTGSLTLAIAAVAPEANITAIDRSDAYVGFARTRVPNDRVRFEVGDALGLPFGDDTFDLTVSMLALNFIPAADQALDEMIRVTRPGGTVAAAVWDYDDGMQMLRVFWDEAIAADPGSERRDERHMPLCREGELPALWREHGLTNVAGDALTIGTQFSSFDDYFSPFLDGQGPAGVYAVSLGAPEREALRLRLRQRLLGDAADGPITMTARAWAVRGVVA